MTLPRPSLFTHSAAAIGTLLFLLPTPGQGQRYADDPLPVNVVDFQPMDIAQMNLDGPPPLPQGPAPVTGPGGDTGGTRGLPTTPRDATGAGIGRTTLPGPTPAPPAANIRLNFQNASLTDVLNSLSASAGFIIVQEQPVTGTISLVSQQPVTADEAIDALNTALADKGYVGIRAGRVLKIIPRENAERRNLPVVVGADPAGIPNKDNLVTQILPVRYLEVGKLVDTLRPLLSDKATVASNDASNALLLTDTQVNIHRIAEIVRALDTNVSSISLIKVYTLRYADAKELADVITQLFTPSTSNRNNPQQGFPGFPFFGGRGGQGGGGNGGRGGGNNAPAAPESAAREAAARVVAVADETTNSVVVSAPDEYMSAIADIVAKLDTNTTELTETQIFKLLHADANEVAASLTTLYSDTTTANGSNGNRGNQPQQGGNRFGPQQPQPQAGGASERAQLQARVIVVADPRTNSVLVNASHATIGQIALTIGRLDASDSRKQHIYVHTLAHADPSNVAYILNGMFNVSGANSNSTTQPSSDSRLATRTTQGASANATSLSTDGSSGASNRSGTSR